MTNTITALFKQRRDAEMAVEHLVQEHGIDRSAIQITAASEANAVGTKIAGGDVEEGHVKAGSDGEPALKGKIRVSAEVDAAKAEAALSSFKTYDGTEISF